MVEHYPPETVLGVVQRFMHLVTDVALAYCGDVKDFEGDGALLYFESTSEAVQAALAIRNALTTEALPDASFRPWTLARVSSAHQSRGPSNAPRRCGTAVRGCANPSLASL